MGERVSHREAARRTGLARSTIWDAVQRGDLLVDENRLIDIADVERIVEARQSAKTKAVKAAAVEKKPKHTILPDGGYVFDIPSYGDVHVPAKVLREMRRAYSKYGGNATIQQVCDEFGLSREAFWAIRGALGWTKTDLPFTDADIAELSEESLVGDYLVRKKMSLARKLQQEDNRLIRKLADKAMHAEEVVDRKVAELVEGFHYKGLEGPPASAHRLPAVPKRRYALAVSPTDLHYGKLGWEGFGPGAYDRKECVRRLEISTARVLRDIAYQPELVIFYVGSDWVHVDTSKGTTTKGTPQDMDGIPEQIAAEALTLLFDYVELWRTIAYGTEKGVKLRLELKAGNHDKLLAYTFFSALRNAYRHAKDVEVAEVTGEYTAYCYGSNLIGATHGDGRSSLRDLADVLATHWPAYWGACTHRYVVRGNLHHRVVEEGHGITSFLLPSLSGSDRYHQSKWPVNGRAQQTALGFDYEQGLWCQVSAGVTP